MQKDITILLVDDEPDIRDLLAYNLEKQGYSVIEGSNGEEAVQLINQIKPDVVVMDIMMPRMDGVSACKMIRAQLQTPQPIILFITARSASYAAQAMAEAGANDYVVKPLHPNLLIDRIEHLLAKVG